MKKILKYLRQLNDFSQDEIAKKIGISRQSYSKYENGSVLPNEQTVQKIAKIYNVNADFIKTGKIPAIPQETNAVQYKINNGIYENRVCEPEISSIANNPEFLEGLFDGISIKITESLDKVKKIGLKKGQKVRVYIEKSQNDEKRKKAWETLMNFKGSLPKNFDYKKARDEALEEKYGSF